MVSLQPVIYIPAAQLTSASASVCSSAADEPLAGAVIKMRAAEKKKKTGSAASRSGTLTFPKGFLEYG